MARLVLVLRVLLVVTIAVGFGLLLEPATMQERTFYVAGWVVASLAYMLDALFDADFREARAR